jgi:hypothetical protein
MPVPSVAWNDRCSQGRPGRKSLPFRRADVVGFGPNPRSGNFRLGKGDPIG